MKYESPSPATEREVLDRIDRATRDSEVIDAALSAIFHCDTYFAGQILLYAYGKIGGPNRSCLGELTCTFLQMHRTDFLADQFLKEMRKDGPDRTAMAACIEEVEEFQAMFAGNSQHIRAQPN